ncbi:MAG: hypothetical protein ABI651_17600 [Verrucomicrobiota bacterium]
MKMCASLLRSLARTTPKRSVGTLVLGLSVSLFALGAAHRISNSPALGDAIGAWDFTGMAAEEKLAIAKILMPDEFNDHQTQVTNPQEIRAAAQSALAIADPITFVQQFPVRKEAAQLAKEAADGFAMLHPVEQQAVMELRKTKEQRDKEKFNVWAIMHPDEYNELVRPLKTASDVAAETSAAEEVKEIQVRPEPLYKLEEAIKEFEALYGELGVPDEN